MKKYGKKIEKRKLLAARISELTGIPARYTFVPRCAYEIGIYTVEKDGTLTVGDGADESVIQTLQAENMIGEELEASAPKRAKAITPSPLITLLPAMATPLGTEEWGEEEEAESEESSETQEQEIWQPDTDIFAERENSTEEEESPAGTEECEPETEEASMNQIQEEEQEEGFDASFSFPISQHTSTSIINLVCMIHSRGALLSKATSGRFYAGKDLADQLLDHSPFPTAKDAAAYIKTLDTEESLVGLTFDEKKVTFDGFGTARDSEHLQTFMKLAAAMNKMAITQKRVQVKSVDDSNEKYALRIWLIRLGLNGSEYKLDRKRLMENLSGHTAFRNEEERARWTSRQAEKRDALKAAKAEKESERAAQETM